MGTLIFAHRGSSVREPENTLVSFQRAEQEGADGIELDVQMTKDGELVVIHDETVNRTTNGKGFVKDFTYAELTQLRIVDKKNKRIFPRSGERIPTLSEVFRWLKTTNLLCNIELKNSVIFYPNLEERVVQEVKDFGLEDRVVYSSFNHDSLAHMLRIDPHAETAVLYKEILHQPWKYVQSFGARGIHPSWKSLTQDVLLETIENGIAVRPYTVNRRLVMEQLFRLQCTAIFTDDPLKAKNVYASLNL